MKRSLIPIVSISLCLPNLVGCGLVSTTGKVTNYAARYEVKAINQSQIDYYLKHQTFATSLDEIKASETENENQAQARFTAHQAVPTHHPIEIEMGPGMVANFAIATHKNLYETEILGKSIILPWHASGTLYSYVGAVQAIEGEAEKEWQWASIVCQSDSPGEVKPELPILRDNQLECAAGSQGEPAPFLPPLLPLDPNPVQP